MFAQLGDIKFELITYFNGLNETVSYNYAQHDRIENKPILQFLGKFAGRRYKVKLPSQFLRAGR